MKIVTLPRPFLANSADTHTDRRQAKQAGWDWGAAHTQPSKIKKSLATRTNNCCVAAARTASKTENIERRRRNEREREQKEKQFTLVSIKQENNNNTRHHTTLTTDNNRRPHTQAHLDNTQDTSRTGTHKTHAQAHANTNKKSACCQ